MGTLLDAFEPQFPSRPHLFFSPGPDLMLESAGEREGRGPWWVWRFSSSTSLTTCTAASGFPWLLTEAGSEVQRRREKVCLFSWGCGSLWLSDALVRAAAPNAGSTYHLFREPSVGSSDSPHPACWAPAPAARPLG